MNKPDFNRAKNIALSLLQLQEHTFTLALNVRNLLFDRRIIIDDFENYANLTGINEDFDLCAQFYSQLRHGCTIRENTTGTYVLLYDGRELNRRRLNWSLAHEVGHIYLGHHGDSSTDELEANYFASQLLIPDALILALRRDGIPITEDFLYRNFYLSRDAAKKKFRYINNYLAPHETDAAIEQVFRTPLARVKSLQARKRIPIHLN